jgi:hypothetical protein
MKIKVGNKTYSSDEQPLVVILEDNEKEMISNMNENQSTYCVYPDTEEWTKNDNKKIKKWMGIFNE